MQLLQNGKQQFIDQNGAPLANGSVGFYAPGTLNPLPTYQDQAGTIANTNPIVLDSRGQALIWGSTTYRQIVKDVSGVTIWDQIVVAANSSSDLGGANGASFIGWDGGTLVDSFKSKLSRVVDSIVALRTLDKTKYTRAQSTGYYAAGDGGGGLYWFDPTDTTSVDNGFTVIVAGDGGRWKLSHNGTIDIRLSGAKGNWNGTTGQDDTPYIQAAMNWVAAQVTAVLETVGGITDVYTGTLPILDFGQGRYKITAALNPPAYFIATGNNAGIIQTSVGADIFYGNGAYKWSVKGINFVGGRNQISVGNGNTDGTIFDFENCEFHLSSDYAVKTFVTGGTYQHMSANLTLRKCYFGKPHGILYNVCDMAIIEDCWAEVNKSNFSASTAAIVSTGSDSHPRLFLKNFFGVPVMGTQGVDRLAGVRWIDNYGSVVATGCRFGGEDAGMAVVSHLIAPPTVTPFLGYQVILRDSWLFSGPSAASDSGAILLNGQVPQTIEITGCLGPAEVPFVVNISGIVTAAYFSNYETGTGTKAYNHFQVKIANNSTDNPDGSVYVARIPAVLRPYIVGAKQTRVSRANNQTITNSFAINPISFDTLNFDNVGGWAVANPTRLVMPLGAGTARITVNAKIAGPAAGCIIAIRLYTSGGIEIAGSEVYASTNVDATTLNLSADVTTSASDYFTVGVLQNSGGNLMLSTATASLTPLDYVG